MKFPDDYPYSPPTFRFITKMFHSNIYQVNNNNTVSQYLLFVTKTKSYVFKL